MACDAYKRIQLYGECVGKVISREDSESCILNVELCDVHLAQWVQAYKLIRLGYSIESVADMTKEKRDAAEIANSAPKTEIELLREELDLLKVSVESIKVLSGIGT